MFVSLLVVSLLACLLVFLFMPKWHNAARSLSHCEDSLAVDDA